MKIITDKDNCCGCMACANVCPKGAIDIIEDENGFKIPCIDKSKCINCGLCANTCPANQYRSNKQLPNAYAAYSLNSSIRSNSSSGGIFAEIAGYILRNQGVVYGVKIINDEAKHVEVTSEKDLKSIMGSKYVQSDVGNTYQLVKKHIENEDLVLYTGTPCQIAGLYNYLSTFRHLNYKTLYTAEVVCHGVPSPKLLKKYLSEKKLLYGSDVEKISFRDKKHGWDDYWVSIKFKNAKKYETNFKEDIYMRAFLKNIALRKSCYNCKFSNFPRAADITLGDYWGVQYKYKHLADNKGISLILLNSEQGKFLINQIKNNIYIENTDLDYAIERNPCIVKSVSEDPNRNNFFKELDKESLENLQEKYFKPAETKKNPITRFLSRIRRKLVYLKNKVLYKK